MLFALSRWTFPRSCKCTYGATLSCRLSYSRWACLPYSLVRFLTLSPFSPHFLQLGDFKFLSVWNLIQLILEACSCALHISAPIHTLWSPFRNHCHVFSQSTRLMSLAYCPCICLSSFFLSLVFLWLDPLPHDLYCFSLTYFPNQNLIGIFYILELRLFASPRKQALQLMSPFPPLSLDRYILALSLPRSSSLFTVITVTVFVFLSIFWSSLYVHLITPPPYRNKPQFYHYCYSNYYYGRTNVRMPRVKIKSFGWAANRNQPQHRLKFVIKKKKIYIYK